MTFSTTLSYIMSMNRIFIFTKLFERIFNQLVEDRKLSLLDYEELEKSLLENPQLGDVIPGMEGLRKLRLKGSGKGKRGGFRIDYLDIPNEGTLYFVIIYPKNVKEDLSSEEKKIVIQTIRKIKKGI